MIFIIALLISSVFLTISKPQSVKAQTGFLFSDDFDANQPNSQFVMGSSDLLNNTDYVSPNNSLQISSQSTTFSHATFDNVTGQLYTQIFYQTNKTGYSYILSLRGETAYIGIYQDQYGIIFDWDYGYNETNVILSPNVWYNITLSSYLDPNQGSLSSATLWLNGSIIAKQDMPQVDGYYLNMLTFDTIRTWKAITNYDDILVSNQPFGHSEPSPTSTPIPTATSTPTPSSSPTPTDSPTPTLSLTPTTPPSISSTPTPKASSTPTNKPTSTDPTTTPTIPEIPFMLAISTFIAITMLLIVALKKHFAYQNLPF